MEPSCTADGKSCHSSLSILEHSQKANADIP